MVKRFLLVLSLLAVLPALTLPSYAVEDVATRQARKRAEAQQLPNQALEALQAKDFDRAIELYTKAINSGAFKDQPDTIGALYFNRGNAYRQKGDCTNAVADYTEALKHVEKGDIYFSRAACYLDQKQEDLALADLDAAVKTDPSAFGYRSARCILLFNRKDFAGALPDCEKALTSKPDDKNLLTAAAQAAEQVGNRARAAELYAKLQSVDPGNPVATEGLKRVGGG